MEVKNIHLLFWNKICVKFLSEIVFCPKCLQTFFSSNVNVSKCLRIVLFSNFRLCVTTQSKKREFLRWNLFVRALLRRIPSADLKINWAWVRVFFQKYNHANEKHQSPIKDNFFYPNWLNQCMCLCRFLTLKGVFPPPIYFPTRGAGEGEEVCMSSKWKTHVNSLLQDIVREV